MFPNGFLDIGKTGLFVLFNIVGFVGYLYFKLIIFLLSFVKISIG